VSEPDESVDLPDLADAFEVVEGHLLGERPSLTRVQVAEQAGVPLEVAEQLWRLLGFPNQTDEAVAFTGADVTALRLTHDLMELGILGPDSQAALVRTWGRSYARLAEWQTSLLADVAIEGPDPRRRLEDLAASVLPRVESLQTYIWRRHLAGAAARLLTTEGSGSPVSTQSVCFVDIVGYTSHSKNLAERELVDWIENFEDTATGIVVDHGARIIKMIGDEILFVADDPEAAAEIALAMTERGADGADPFPSVRAGLAHGPVVSRLGDVFGSVVNIAARLTSVARPGTVLVDDGAHRALAGPPEADADAGAGPEADDAADGSPYRFRRMRRVSVKGYPRLQCWVLRRAAADGSR
jgi:adenylate cyclase